MLCFGKWMSGAWPHDDVNYFSFSILWRSKEGGGVKKCVYMHIILQRNRRADGVLDPNQMREKNVQRVWEYCKESKTTTSCASRINTNHYYFTFTTM